jgi:hypothetical protein
VSWVPSGIRTLYIRSPSSKIVNKAQLKIPKGVPHGMCTTRNDDINADLMSFIGVRSSNPVVVASAIN